jgi:hypothetical protein
MFNPRTFDGGYNQIGFWKCSSPLILMGINGTPR